MYLNFLHTYIHTGDFQAFGNNIQGEIPTALGELENLKVINLAENNLVGTIPSSIGQSGNLLSLVLRNNRLTGSIPPGLASSTDILHINLSENDPDKDATSGIDGQIPDFFGSFTKLKWLKLHGNRLQGEIPASLSDATSLVHVTLHDNFLRGEVPTGFCDATDLTNTRSGMKNLTADCDGEPRIVECSCCTVCISGSSISVSIVRNGESGGASGG
mmetsp:Transcript_558/g.916  ORF Transcript_558/g.916 Transcript_558/m.916 type:complete len:216 (+) Transcript_558:2846-3493(+)